jgi:hypothetical protein
MKTYIENDIKRALDYLTQDMIRDLQDNKLTEDQIYLNVQDVYTYLKK